MFGARFFGKHYFSEEWFHALTLAATVASVQGAQVTAATGSTASTTSIQAGQVTAATGKIIFTGTVGSVQAGQVTHATESEIFTGTAASVQQHQNTAATGNLTFTYHGTVNSVQAPQNSSATGSGAKLGKRHFWRILIFDASKKLVDIPQADVESWNFTSALNGGSGAAQIQFVRDFNKVGALGYGYSVLIWIWTEGTTRPTDPIYGGTIIDGLEQEQLEARGRVTVTCKGDMSLLDAGIVSSTVTGGIGGATAMPDAATYLGSMVPTYQPTTFTTPDLPGAMFTLWPLQFDGTGLGAAIDTVVKQGLDTSGRMWTWFVKTAADLTRKVVVQIDQNPNTVSGPTFSYQWPGITCDQYDIKTNYRDILNVITVYGGKDPATGQQVFISTEDGTSVSAFGPWETKQSQPALLTNAGAQSWAEVWLTEHAFPQAQGTARLLNPDPTVIPGRWVQFNETPATASDAAVIKQVRVAQIQVSCNGQRIEQVISTASPMPYLDDAIYRLGLNVSAQGAIAIKPLPINQQTMYVRAGGLVADSAHSPAKVTITACEATFPSTGLIIISALSSTTVADSVSHVGGDGDYTVWANSAGTFTFVRGTPPAPTATSQLIARISVIGGVPFVTDGRTFIAMPAINQSTSLALSGSATLGSPTNAGTGAYDQPVSFTLTSTGTIANSGLSNLQLGWRQNGTTSVQIAPSGSQIQPNASGSYTGTVPGIGAGSATDIYVRGVDTNDRPTGWLFLGTTTPQNLNLANYVTNNLPIGNNTPVVAGVGGSLVGTAGQVAASAFGVATGTGDFVPPSSGAYGTDAIMCSVTLSLAANPSGGGSYAVYALLTCALLDNSNAPATECSMALFVRSGTVSSQTNFGVDTISYKTATIGPSIAAAGVAAGGQTIEIDALGSDFGSTDIIGPCVLQVWAVRTS